MRIVNIHEAKTQLSKLVDLASKGAPEGMTLLTADALLSRYGGPVRKI